jgi:hypothetical protein
MRSFARPLLVVLAGLFLLWELYAAIRWLGQTGGVIQGFEHLWGVLRRDWMALIVVSDHLVIAGAVLIGLWLDATRMGWRISRRLLLALAFVAVGSPALLLYVAWRIDEV